MPDAAAPPAPPAPAPVTRGLDLQGHRGARGLAPENTLSAFARALSIGVTTLELDLGVTKDGVVVVSHDAELNPDHTRDAAGRWLAAPGPAVFGLTFDELRRYDVGRLAPGTAYAARFPDQAPLDGQRIPSLREVVALTRRAGNARVRFNIETKIDPRSPGRSLPPEAFAEAVLRVVREEDIGSRVTIQSFDWRTLAHVRRMAPEIPTVCLTQQLGPDANVPAGRAGASSWLAGLDPDDFGGSMPRLVKAAGHDVWSPFVGDVTREAVAEAHRLGLLVVVWTVNEPALMETLIDAGADGIISDYPDRLREVAKKRGLPLPEPTPVTP